MEVLYIAANGTRSRNSMSTSSVVINDERMKRSSTATNLIQNVKNVKDTEKRRQLLNAKERAWKAVAHEFDYNTSWKHQKPEIHESAVDTFDKDFKTLYENITG